MANQLDDQPTVPEVQTDVQTAGSQHEVTVRVVTDDGGGGGRGGRRRRRLSLASFMVMLALGAAAAVGFVVVGAITGFLHNPFSTTIVDRSQPALLQQVANLSKYDAAQGRFTTTLDVEKDVGLLPSFVAGERTVFLAEGSVDASVDFGTITSDAVVTDGNGHVTITLPTPTLEKPVLDTDKSHVASRQRGIVDRIAGMFSDNPTSEQGMYHLAEKKLAAAARHSKLVDRAERNTTAMLQGFLGKLGYTDVQVVFSSPAATT
jgi:hypothetical protein